MFKVVNLAKLVKVTNFLQKNIHQVWGLHVPKNFMKLAQLETPKKVFEIGGGLWIKIPNIFILQIKNHSIAIKFCTLVEDGVYIVAIIFVEL